MTEYLKAAVTLLAVINPFVCGVMLLQIEGGLPRKDRIVAATKSSLSIVLILLFSALAGKSILNFFGISMDAFQIIGGVIIAYIGFGMFTPSQKPASVGQTDKTTLSKLIMFAASPGTIASVIAISAAHDTTRFPIIAMGGVIIAVVLTWIIMLIMSFSKTRTQKGGQHIISQILGLILISMGLQFVLTGLKDFFT